MIETERVTEEKKHNLDQKPALTQEKNVYQSTDLYKRLFDRMNDAAVYCKVVYDDKQNPIDLTFLDVNLAFKRLTHMPGNLILNKKVSESVPILNKICLDWMDKYSKVSLNRKSITIEKFCPSLNKWLTFSAYSPEKGYFAVIIKDLTWRKKIEQELRQGEKKHKKLANSITAPFFAVDSSLKFSYWNKASEKFMGFNSADVIGKHFFEVFGKNKATRKIAGVYLDVMRTKNPRTLIDVLPKAGAETFFEIEVYPTGNGIAVLAKDITERKKQQISLEVYAQRLEEILRVRTEKLKNAERLAAIGETAGMIGHDIRNPLQSIIGELFLAKDELRALPETDAQKYLLQSINYIEEQTLYINKIVTDLQDYAKPLTPTCQEIDLEQTIQDSILLLDIPQNIKILCTILKPFPVLKTDPSFIKRILSNLIRNGVQAMEETGGELTLNAFPRESSVIIAVSDTGGGIPEAVKERIFKPLFTTKSKGQGFGLAVVKKLAEALGGSVSFETKVGKGTTFIVELPLQSNGLA